MLSQCDTVAVLLPGTSFYLNLDEHAPARKLIEKGAAVALGSDFNPGSCHIFSAPFILALACLHLSMTPEEALTALTINSACAIGRGSEVGMLKEGYQADIAIYGVPTLEEVPYNIGFNTITGVIKSGALVVSDKFNC
jgi:imidazolonepropionase